MKKFRLLGLVLAICLAFTAFAACGGKEKTVDQVKTAFENEGYTVVTETVSGETSLVATKDTDILMVSFCSSDAVADTMKAAYDLAASLAGQTCKREGKIVYYGTTAAVAIFDAI